MEKENLPLPFEGKEIRKIWHNDEWYFSVIDVVEVLTDSPSPKTYWDKLKTREFQTPPFWEQLKLKAKDGRQRLTDCAHTEGIFRIVMSVPSPKAEPLKLWLAQVGRERIQETENPELGFERLRQIYKTKGYPEDWIGYREKSISVRKELTEEWKNRGIKENSEYSILTAEIAKETFGLTPSQHAQLKGLEKQNLRDHMTTLELIFSALGEEVTRQIAIDDNAQGFHQNHEAAVRGGRTASEAKERVETQLKKPVVSPQNFLHLNSSDKPKELSTDGKKD